MSEILIVDASATLRKILMRTGALDPGGQLGLPDFSDTAPNGAMEGAPVCSVAQGVMSVEVWLD